jgi:hypothetical protein
MAKYIKMSILVFLHKLKSTTYIGVFFFPFQFSDVVDMAIIHKPI